MFRAGNPLTKISQKQWLFVSASGITSKRYAKTSVAKLNTKSSRDLFWRWHISWINEPNNGNDCVQETMKMSDVTKESAYLSR